MCFQESSFKYEQRNQKVLTCTMNGDFRKAPAFKFLPENFCFFPYTASGMDLSVKVKDLGLKFQTQSLLFLIFLSS